MANRPLVVKDTVQEILAEPGITTYDPADDPIVRARGLNSPGDGGGGTFRVTGSGVETDGGTVFVFNEDVSGEKSQEISGWDPWNLPQSDLIWGTLGVRYGPDSEDVLSGLDMHGHTRNQVVFNGSSGWVDHGSGTIYAGGNALKNLNQDFGDGSQEYTVTYKHATSDRRLERVHPPGVFNLAWWGAPKADPDNPVSSTPYINWAVNTAKERYLEGGVEWAYVDIAGEYYYLHHTQILDGVMLRGVGEERPVPNRSFTTRGKLTLMPGEAIYTQHESYDPIADHDEYAYLGGATRSTFGHETGASEKLGIQNLEIDGNLANNTQVFTTDEYPGKDNWLQNSGDWAAWYTTGAGGQSYEKGLEVWINDVYAHGFGGNIFAGAGAELTPQGTGFDVTGPGGVSKNVKGKDAIKNHQIYDIAGHMENWSTAGASWANPLRIGSKANRPTTFVGLTVEEHPVNPYGYNVRDVVSLTGLNMTLDDLTVDLSESQASIQDIFVFKRGPYYTDEISDKSNIVKNSTIKLQKENFVGLLRDVSIHSKLTFKNVELQDYGGGIRIGKSQNYNGFNLEFEDVDIVPKNNPGEWGGNVDNPWERPALFSFHVQSKHDNISAATRNVFRNFNMQREWGGYFMITNSDVTKSDIHPHDQYYINSSFNLVSNPESFWSKNGNLGSSDLEVMVFLNNTTLDNIDWRDSNEFHGNLGAGAPARMRNCQDAHGRTSDAVDQSYTATSSDESDGYALIPTSLMSRPGEMSVTANSGYNVTGVEVANSDGTVRADDDTDEEDPYLKVSVDGSITQGDAFTWTARVTPMDEYKTTGLFVARKESDKSYTSGNGPFTVDLRGMASSQESRDPVVYTATSSNASVVTANVQDDGYILELTEQGTGTATITVTGEIPGVGTASTTFDVTIS